jgi:hypothetical protein
MLNTGLLTLLVITLCGVLFPAALGAPLRSGRTRVLFAIAAAVTLTAIMIRWLKGG